MLPRRRIVGGDSEKTSLLEHELDNYSKLDKKGYTKPYSSDSSAQPDCYRPSKGLDYSGDFTFDFLEDPVFETVMASRDRTSEFVSTVRSLQGRMLTRPAVRDVQKAAVLETYSQFMSMAKVISKNITSTYAKLEKLALCKLTSFLNFVFLSFHLSFIFHYRAIQIFCNYRFSVIWLI